MKWFLLFATLILAGCSTMTKEQCEKADWKDIGLIDGQKGREYEYLNRHRSSCQDSSATINSDAYKAGWQEGLKVYCTAVNGYKTGASGGTSTVCPEKDFLEFHQQYELGREVYSLGKEKELIKERIKKREEDKSFIADLGRVSALLQGRSYTSDLEEESQDISSRMIALERKAPLEVQSSTLPLYGPGETESLINSTGALVGSFVGFGIGHAIQGRYGSDGWKWTVGEVATIGFMMSGDINCEYTASSSGQSERVCNREGNFLGFLTWLGFRVWQGYDLFTYKTKNEYSRVMLLPRSNGPELAWTF